MTKSSNSDSNFDFDGGLLDNLNYNMDNENVDMESFNNFNRNDSSDEEFVDNSVNIYNDGSRLVTVK